METYGEEFDLKHVSILGSLAGSVSDMAEFATLKLVAKEAMEIRKELVIYEFIAGMNTFFLDRKVHIPCINQWMDYFGLCGPLLTWYVIYNF